MRKLYEALLEELKAGRWAVLCSIVASSGSPHRRGWGAPGLPGRPCPLPGRAVPL